MNQKVKCIQCGRKKSVRVIEKEFGPDEYHCSDCGAHFDADPDEGGTHGKYPDQRIMREEKQRQRRLGKKY